METRFSAHKKENMPPINKQGILYAIKTNKNLGVYLAKDISHNNYKSLSLLTPQARQAHKSYVETLEANFRKAQNTLQKTKKLSDVESFNHTYQFSMKTLKKVSQYSQQCGSSIKSLHEDMSTLKESILTQTNQLQQMSIPVLKNLREKLKNGKSQQSAVCSKMKRELQQIQNCFRIVGNGIKQCNRRLKISNEIYGNQQPEFQF